MLKQKLHRKNITFLSRFNSSRLCAVHSSTRVADAAVVLNSLALDGLPHLLDVAGCLDLLALGLEASLGSGCDGAGARRSGGRHALRVEDRVGLVHLLVVLLDGLPRLGDVAVRVLRALRGGGGVAGSGGGAGCG